MFIKGQMRLDTNGTHSQHGEGLEQLSWDMVELYNEVQRLRYHNGYPNRIHSRCPILLTSDISY